MRVILFQTVAMEPERPYRLAFAKLMPGCEVKAEAATEDELRQRATTHASEAHGIKEITPELVAKDKSIIERV